MEKPVEAEVIYEESIGDTDHQFADTSTHIEVPKYQGAESSDHPEVPKYQYSEASAHYEFPFSVAGDGENTHNTPQYVMPMDIDVKIFIKMIIIHEGQSKMQLVYLCQRG